VQDRFELGLHMKEPGWDYQWITITVVGNSDVAAQHVNMMSANGWRPVPANRPGFREWFGLSEQAATIDIEGLRLVERPMALTEQARADEYGAAVGQIQDRQNALKGNKGLQETLARQGYEPVEGYRGQKTSVRIDADVEAPVPSHEIAPSQ
jgi:hypothetical protein